MTPIISRTERAIALSLVFGASLAVAACSFKDELLEPQQPATIGVDAVSDASGAEALVVGALQSFQSATAGSVSMWSAA